MALYPYCGILVVLSLIVLCEGNVRRDRLTGHSENFFKGYRYVKDNDNTTKILYDCHGYVAGIQTTMNEAVWHYLEIRISFEIKTTAEYPTLYNSVPWHRNEDGTISATAYFRHPQKICSCKRLCKKPSPMGDRLWIQLGDIGDNKFMVIPLNMKAIANTHWVEGNCVNAMGMHYHYNISRNFDCNYALPVFLIANTFNGDVHGFGWGVPLAVDSKRWEHPAPELFARSIKEENIPDCVLKYKVVSIQHFYFVDPLKISCL